MIEIEEVKKIITAWAKTLPFRVRIHLFGSYLKRDKDEMPSDIDVSLELLDISSVDERRDLSFEYRKDWEDYLSQMFGMKVDLQFYDKNMKSMPRYLQEASLLLYESSKKVNEY